MHTQVCTAPERGCVVNVRMRACCARVNENSQRVNVHKTLFYTSVYEIFFAIKRDVSSIFVKRYKINKGFVSEHVYTQRGV